MSCAIGCTSWDGGECICSEPTLPNHPSRELEYCACRMLERCWAFVDSDVVDGVAHTLTSCTPAEVCCGNGCEGCPL